MNQVTIEKTRGYLIVKIPLKSVDVGEAGLSSRSQKIIDDAVAEGLRDIKDGRVFGPFSNIKEFKKSLVSRSKN